jgi:hypothetical protein
VELGTYGVCGPHGGRLTGPRVWWEIGWLRDADGNPLDFRYPHPERPLTEAELAEWLRWYDDHLRSLGVGRPRERRAALRHIEANLRPCVQEGP